jgi:hypothetical protein
MMTTCSGRLEKVDAALEGKPESMKGYTIGDDTHKDTSRYPVADGRRKGHVQGLPNLRLVDRSSPFQMAAERPLSSATLFQGVDPP